MIHGLLSYFDITISILILQYQNPSGLYWNIGKVDWSENSRIYFPIITVRDITEINCFFFISPLVQTPSKNSIVANKNTTLRDIRKITNVFLSPYCRTLHVYHQKKKEVTLFTVKTFSYKIFECCVSWHFDFENHTKN